LYQTEGKIDAVIIGAGTGGTIAGIGRKIKERLPSCQVVAADPVGSILAIPASLNVEGPPNKVEGIGYDFIPRTCMRESVDYWVKTEDPESFLNARDLISKEGLLVGGSSGAVLFAAKQFIKDKGWQGDKTKRVVCVFQDSIRNYITKFLSKEWCIENKFIPYEELKEEGNPFTGV
jgi:cystathionine beta-synthase